MPTPPDSAGANFFWGVALLQNNGLVSFVGLVKDQPQALAAGHLGAAADTISNTVDGNNYLWFAVYTRNAAGTLYYEDVFECTTSVVTTPTGCTSATWDTSTVIQVTATNDLQDNPEVLPLNNGGSYYVALTYVDPANANAAGSYTSTSLRAGLRWVT